MYINVIFEFIVIIVTNITTFLDILDQNFGVTDTRKCANLDDHTEMTICTPNLEKHKRIINSSNLPSIFKRYRH